MTISWVPPIVRRRVKEVDPRKDERRVRAELHPRTGAISISHRRLLAGATGFSADYSKGEK